MSNFCLLKSENEHILDRLFPNLRQIPKIHQTDMVGIIFKLHSAKNICSPMQCFFCKLVQMSNFGRLKSANGHILDRLFPSHEANPKNPSLRIWWHYLRAPVPPKRCCSPCSAFSVNWCKCPMLNSANEHILDRLFPNLRQIPKIHHDVYGGYYLEAPLPQKIFALQYSAFSVNWCKCPILVG